MAPGAPRHGPARPAVDERLVAPETRFEVLDGTVMPVSPADPPHGTRHAQVTALLEAHVHAGFEVACDMLTRTSELSDVAPDVSVFPEDPDPETGGRQIEHLAFEIVSTETLGHAAGKAATLAARGVRRVFVIDVERSRALEWSAAMGTWAVLDPDGQIEDPVLAAPLPIDALIRSAAADDAMARALLTKRNPVLEAARRQDRAEGKIEGKVEGKVEGRIEGKIEGELDALFIVLTARGIAVDHTSRERILAERDRHRIERWITRATTSRTLAEILDER